MAEQKQDAKGISQQRIAQLENDLMESQKKNQHYEKLLKQKMEDSEHDQMTMKHLKERIVKLEKEVLMMQKTQFLNDEIKENLEKEFAIAKKRLEGLGIALRQFAVYEYQGNEVVILKVNQ